ncbi:MAG: hypothetical protein EOO75_08440 [Myxococcales bacterium]|nr:MAG: hypothetical protein EOO75_08440 [Myxococcales bacterium]
MNGGFFTSKVPDADTAALGVAVGVNSQRCKLTEQHLTTWGDEIEVGDMKAYQALGMTDLVVFLGGPIAAHSNAPAGKADWELEQYSPRNLYEPIWLPDGEVNPDNHWASFVARVATTYGPYLRTYEVWNEPDQVGGNWQATLDWDTSPPKPSDLLWWNDTIFAYVRALRVAHEVIHKLDPDGQVALGGIGYPSFLGALLRYSDEPTAGQVGGDYPAAGGAYFDVLSFHYYPVFSPGNSDAGAAGLLGAKADLQARLDAAGVSGKSWMVTESGAPRYALGSSPGGEAYARNYLLKAMTLGHDADLGGIDWFILGDGQKPGQSQDPFAYMGLYLNYSDVQSKDEAVKTPTGIAYATLGQVLGGATRDPAATQALALPATVGGAAFRTADGHRAHALWARSGQGEDAATTHELPGDRPVRIHAWDASQTGQSTTVAPSGGKVSLALTSSPLLVVEQ